MTKKVNWRKEDAISREIRRPGVEADMPAYWQERIPVRVRNAIKPLYTYRPDLWLPAAERLEAHARRLPAGSRTAEQLRRRARLFRARWAERYERGAAESEPRTDDGLLDGLM